MYIALWRKRAARPRRAMAQASDRKGEASLPVWKS